MNWLSDFPTHFLFSFFLYSPKVGFWLYLMDGFFLCMLSIRTLKHSNTQIIPSNPSLFGRKIIFNSIKKSFYWFPMMFWTLLPIILGFVQNSIFYRWKSNLFFNMVRSVSFNSTFLVTKLQYLFIYFQFYFTDIWNASLQHL